MGNRWPTRASFVFSHGVALAEAGHELQIFLTHDATYLMRKATVDPVKPIGWPPKRDYGENCRQKDPGIFLRSLFPGPWGHGRRPEQLECPVGNSSHLCFPGGMGRPRHQRIKSRTQDPRLLAAVARCRMSSRSHPYSSFISAKHTICFRGCIGERSMALVTNLDLWSAVLGLTLFPDAYLLHAPKPHA